MITFVLYKRVHLAGGALWVDTAASPSPVLRRVIGFMSLSLHITLKKMVFK